jgi:nitrate reductase delta subunit
VSPFELLSLALRYPDHEVAAARAEVAALARDLPGGEAADHIRAFAAWWAAVPADALRAEYVATFDFSRRTALDLTYITHGDRRQRGLALLALRRRYAAEGFRLDSPELSDHLPVMLEFAAAAPGAGVPLLQDFHPVLELLLLGLRRVSSPYADALAAVCALLPPLDASGRAEVRRMAAEGPPAETVGLEPFAPPEVMPEPVRPARTPCATAAGGTR